MSDRREHSPMRDVVEGTRAQLPKEIFDTNRRITVLPNGTIISTPPSTAIQEHICLVEHAHFCFYIYNQSESPMPIFDQQPTTQEQQLFIPPPHRTYSDVLLSQTSQAPLTTTASPVAPKSGNKIIDLKSIACRSHQAGQCRRTPDNCKFAHKEPCPKCRQYVHEKSEPCPAPARCLRCKNVEHGSQPCPPAPRSSRRLPTTAHIEPDAPQSPPTDEVAPRIADSEHQPAHTATKDASAGAALSVEQVSAILPHSSGKLSQQGAEPEGTQSSQVPAELPIAVDIESRKADALSCEQIPAILPHSSGNLSQQDATSPPQAAASSSSAPKRLRIRYTPSRALPPPARMHPDEKDVCTRRSFLIRKALPDAECWENVRSTRLSANIAKPVEKSNTSVAAGAHPSNKPRIDHRSKDAMRFDEITIDGISKRRIYPKARPRCSTGQNSSEVPDEGYPKSMHRWEGRHAKSGTPTEIEDVRLRRRVVRFTYQCRVDGSAYTIDWDATPLLTEV